MHNKVAIIGCSYRLPGSDAAGLWDDLLNGRDLVTQVDPERWDLESFQHPDRNHPGTSYTFAAGSIGDISGFDSAFFGISPREAAMMDPQQRLLLELGWEVMENAGIPPSSLRGSDCGVYIGISTSDNVSRVADDLAVVDATSGTGNATSITANRLSYFFDLHGPSMAIDTACSSTLVAFHHACRSIISGETSLALAGGICLHLHPYGFLTFSKATMLSRRGHCSPFDAEGDGYVRSEGGGLFLLKDYDRAVADGDRIMAVVAGSAVNTDGRKSGLTVPNCQAQTALLEKVYRQSGIDPKDIDYLEAHGTGTAVGDPIETRALGEALGRRRPASDPLPIGSIKSNMGHLEAAAGVAGLVKALLCIRHRRVPATIGFKTPNPAILFDDWNLEVVSKQRHLKPTGRLIVGINSFGFGGANAHVILESPAETRKKKNISRADCTPLPFIISAKDTAALKAACRGFASVVDGLEGNLYDIAYGSVFRRDWHDQRVMICGEDAASITRTLLDFADDKPGTAPLEIVTKLEHASGPAFIFTGNGSQWAGMGRRLMQDVPLFRESVREIDAIFQKYADYSIEDELNGTNGEGRYAYTECAQPALFALQVGITRVLASRGITPVAVAGHSVGEIAAAWASGALSLHQAVEVIYFRSMFQGKTKGQGSMTAVGQGWDAGQALLEELGLASVLTLAGSNSPKGITLAGNPADLSRLESQLSILNIPFKRLDLDYAFHSPVMDSLETGIVESLADLIPVENSIPYYSTVTGQMLDGCRLDAGYWWDNIRKPVLFDRALGAMIKQGINLFVEIGPHAILRGYIHDCLNGSNVSGRVVPTGMRDDDDPSRIWGAVHQVVLAGGPAALKQFFPRQGAFIALPNYPWQRERCRQPLTAESCGLLVRHKIHPLLGYELKQSQLCWENQIDTVLIPMLKDHVVGHATVFPGAGFVELALAAAFAWHAGDCLEVEELEIRVPLGLDDRQAKIVRFSINPQDGSSTFSGRELLSSEQWKVYGVSRILSPSHDLLLAQLDHLTLPNRCPDFTAEQHAERTRLTGLEYGPAFQAIKHGWIEKSSAVAQLYLPASVEADLGRYHLHPAILDCAFQLIFQILKDEVSHVAGMTYVPVKVGRVVFRPGSARPDRAAATLLRRTGHSLLADVSLYDADGVPVALLKDVRFRSVRISNQTHDPVHFLKYFATPMPNRFAVKNSSVHSLDQALERIGQAVRKCVVKGGYRVYSEEVEPLLDGLCSRFALEALQALSDVSRHIAYETIGKLRDQQPEIGLFCEQLVSIAVQDGLLVPDASGWTFPSVSDDSPKAVDIWNSLFTGYPDYFPIIHAVGGVGTNLRSLIEGGVQSTSIFPDAVQCSRLIASVLDAASRQKIGRALVQLISGTLTTLPEGQRFDLLEISGGAPLFAPIIGESLDFNRCDYRIVSVLPAGSDEMGELVDRFPQVAVRELDAEEDLPLPGSRLSNLVILSGTFTSPLEAQRALVYARSRIAVNGTIVHVGFHPSRWVDFAFAGQSAKHESKAGTHSFGQLTAAFWQQMLERQGFSPVSLLELVPQAVCGPYLLLATADTAESLPSHPATRDSRVWLWVTDEAGCADHMHRRIDTVLQNSGDHVVHSTLSVDTSHFEALLLEIRERPEPFQGIVLFSGSGKKGAQSDSLTSFAAQVTRCATAAAIFQACETLKIETTVWLVTNGASGALLPASNGYAESCGLPEACADAALWGFGRTMMNETRFCTVRLVDIDGTGDNEILANALLCELEQPDSEQEVLIASSGDRFVPRLRLVPRSESSNEIKLNDTHQVLRLRFPLPGQLKNLCWEVDRLPEPADDELEIDVQATGLNFRDVMYTLGLLSDEAVENGFAGPTLGLEFSGIVRRTGKNSTVFSKGDRVVGFGPSSFSTRVIIKDTTVSHIPPGISFEAAATIPTTFFTAWYALHHLARLKEGEKVLIHGAAGGVGLAAIQVARWCGAEIYATAGSGEKRDLLRLMGIEHVFDSRSLLFADQIMSITGGKGIDVVLNSLAGEAINRNLQILKPFGRFLELGKRDFYENTRIGLRPFRNNISYFGIDADQLMQEHPLYTRQIFNEIMNLFNEGQFHPLPYQAFEANDVVDAFRYMQQSRQIGKIVVTYRQGISRYSPAIENKPSARLHVDADASYLVTGGLSGFGLKTAEWLIDRGARHLVLLSRRGPNSPEAVQAVSEFEKRGIAVFAVSCDITNKKALSELLDEVSTRMPPLKGVVHAAAVFEDALVSNLLPEQISRVLAPKILGAWHLHELTAALPLDLFVVFSSATTLFGNPGQANYVAANTWMESLAALRRSCGLPALCVGWGAIGDAGFLARNEKIRDALQNRLGGAALNSAAALDILESLVLENRSGLGVLELEWKSVSRFLPTAGTPKFGELACLLGGPDTGEAHDDDMKEMLEHLSDADLSAAVADMIRYEVSEILRIAPDKIDIHRSLYDMGLDSLMGVELVTALESRFSIRMAVMTLREGPTIARLAERIILQLKGASLPDEADGADRLRQVADLHAADIDPDAVADFTSTFQTDNVERMIS